MPPAELLSTNAALAYRQDGGSNSIKSTHWPDPSAGEASPRIENCRHQPKAEHAITKLLGEEKSHEWHALTSKEGPVRLLDLPVDVLNLVIKEVTHTNDLVALALTHSALHKLTIPQIYSRFDIVWPDTSSQAEPRTGVDALTYGLATLVMAEDVFGESPSQPPQTCNSCGHCNEGTGKATSVVKPRMHAKAKRRRGNYYAEYTKKFSLGNGPEEWIKEYLANTESGKMLGTLVALAIARMRSLESFIWDMPTGVLPEVWHALASLGDREDGRLCRLEKVWVRWHNNGPLVEGKFVLEATPHEPHAFWQSHSEMSRQVGDATKYASLDKRMKVERPNFSMLPPLKSLNVLDIDECAYLDELSILVSESRQSLKELRIGIADHAVSSNWAYPWLDYDLNQVAEGKSRFTGNISVFEKRLGGTLGVLTGYLFDLKRERAEALRASETTDEHAVHGASKGTESYFDSQSEMQSPVHPATAGGSQARFVEDLSHSSNQSPAEDEFSKIDAVDVYDNLLLPRKQRLHLETLALERISLSVPILSHAFDWTSVRNITFIDCQYTAMFWNLLRRRYTPVSNVDDPLKTSTSFLLKLRKIHTNTVTPTLLAFLRETLAPNSLEVLFLQQSEYHVSKVTPEKIMSVIKRHRGSLRKLLVDSSERDDSDHGSVRAHDWGRWQFNRSMVNFVTSGKMPKLKEIAMAISFKDWHYLIQRLPYCTSLRALYLTYITKSPGNFVQPDECKELAFQILDILTIRPDIGLCYLAIGSKCFEIIESRVKASDLQLEAEPSAPSFTPTGPGEPEDEGTEADDEDDAESVDGDDDEDGGADGQESETEESSVLSEDVEEAETEEDDTPRVKMSIREILFYDDKVAVFKARHGRL